jgi:hypothetical protein
MGRAKSSMEEFGHRLPDDTLLHNLGIPSAAALMALNRKSPERAIEALQVAAPYELGVAEGLSPRFYSTSGIAAGKAWEEAAAEFQKIVDRGIAPTAIEHGLINSGSDERTDDWDTAKARAIDQDFSCTMKRLRPRYPCTEGSEG